MGEGGNMWGYDGQKMIQNGGVKMSNFKICELLGVAVGQEFNAVNHKMDIVRGPCKINAYGRIVDATTGCGIYGHTICDLVNGDYKIIPKPDITETEKIIARGRIAEGTPWIARDSKEEFGTLYCFSDKPTRGPRFYYNSNSNNEEAHEMGSQLFQWITYENSPIDLRAIVKD